MKILKLLTLLFMLSIVLGCAKKKSDPQPDPVIQPVVTKPKEKGTFTYTLNDNGKLLTADSVHWDIYNNTNYRLQAFVGSVAVLTLWPSSVATHSQELPFQTVYWYDGSTIYSPGSGNLNLTNVGDVLSGSIVATGKAFNPSGSATSSIKADFKNVSKVAFK